MGLTRTELLALLDADSRAYADAVATHLPPAPFGRYGVAAVRGMLDSAASDRPPIRAVHGVEERMIDTPDGPIRVRIYRPTAGSDLPALLYFHGGGFVIGTLEGVDDVCRLLCDEAGCVVISVEYRRAPEHPFPAAANDAGWAYDWTVGEAARLGVDPARIALAGDSAGGNLALSVCVTLIHAGRPLPSALVLAYPATSSGHLGESWDRYEHAPVLCKEDAQWFWSHYAASGDVERDPRAVPALCADLGLLPPTFIVSAEVDVLRSDYEAFAAAMTAAGADVELRRYDGVLHGFFTEVASIGQAAAAVTAAAAHLRRVR